MMQVVRDQGVRLGRQRRAAWPEALRHPEVRGVFVGGCVDRGVGSKFHAKAHAHTSGENVGWICFRSTRWLGCVPLLKHELAHVVTGEGHTPRWRHFLLQIGGTLDEVPGILQSYHARPRNVSPAGLSRHGRDRGVSAVLCGSTPLEMRARLARLMWPAMKTHHEQSGLVPPKAG